MNARRTNSSVNVRVVHGNRAMALELIWRRASGAVPLAVR